MKNLRLLSRPFAVAAVLSAAALLLPTAHAAPPAGTNISNQASATYLDGNSVSRSTTSNSVLTTVAQVRSFALSTDGQSRNAAPGQTVYFSHALQNSGNGQDTYQLTSSTTGSIFTGAVQYYVDANGDGLPDNATPITSLTVPAFAAQPTRFVAAVVVSSSAAQSAQGSLTVTATDGGNTARTNTDAVTIANAAIAVTKSLSLTSGPSPQSGITVTLAYTNSGTAAATNLVLTDALPTGMTYASGSGRWSVSGTTTLTDANDSADPSGITYQVTGSTVTATVGTVNPGSSGQVTFTVNIPTGLAPTNQALTGCTTQAGCPVLTTNTAQFSYTAPGNVPVAATPTNAVTYSVTQFAGVIFNGSNVAPPVAGTGLPLSVATAPQASVVTYTGYVWNTGNGTDTFNMTVPVNNFPGGTQFQFYRPDGTTPLQDTNNDGTPDTGPLAVGGSTAVVIKAVLPNSATGTSSGNPWTATVRATSTVSGSVSDSGNVSLGTIGANLIDLTGNAAFGGGTAVGTGPGAGTSVATNNVTPVASSSTTSVFRLYVNNRGDGSDSYNLAATGLPAGWSSAFYADGGTGTCSSLGTPFTNTGAIPNANNRLVCFVVTVPSIASGNAAPQSPLLTVTATSASTANADNISVTVAVQSVNNVTLVPNGQQQTFPGSSVTYIHTLQNLGNTSQNITFATGFLTDSQAAAGWTSAAYVDSNNNGTLEIGGSGGDALIDTSTSFALGVGSTRTLFVRVFAPSSVTASSPADVTQLRASYGVNTTSVTDTTSITDGLLLNKQHVRVATCTGGTPATGWTTNPYNGTVAGFDPIPPGQCVAYQIVGTNTTSNQIGTIVVNDGTPANTTLETGCGAVTASTGFTVNSAPANGGTGTFTVSSNSGVFLSPGSSFAITFCVRINP